jgi:hypothetical protein
MLAFCSSTLFLVLFRNRFLSNSLLLLFIVPGLLADSTSLSHTTHRRQSLAAAPRAAALPQQLRPRPKSPKVILVARSCHRAPVRCVACLTRPLAVSPSDLPASLVAVRRDRCLTRTCLRTAILEAKAAAQNTEEISYGTSPVGWCRSVVADPGVPWTSNGLCLSPPISKCYLCFLSGFCSVSCFC